MPTIPTGQMERELRKLYLQWLTGLSYDSKDLPAKLASFEARSQELIERLGGRTAALGALADFPVPKRLDLSPHIGTIYSDMQQAAIQAGIVAGLQSTDVARQMFSAGMDKSFNRLNRLARTETTNAYWKNAFDSIADLPALVMVWGSEDGKRTCPWCRERDGLVMASSELRDHPNGRCTPIPTLRSQVKYRGSVDRDGSMFHDPAWDERKTVNQPTRQIDYEEKFVKDFEKNLETGVWSRAQLRAMAGQDNVSALGKANAQEALRRYKEKTAARPASHAKASLPELTEAQVAALQPPAKFTEAVRNRALRALDETKAGKLVKDQLTKFQSGPRGAIAKLRNDVQAYVTGARDLPKGRIDTIEAVLGAVRSSPVPDGIQLQRGMMMPGDFKSVMARYEDGDSLDLSISSFTSSRLKAEEFTRITEGTKVQGQTTQMLVTIRGQAHALPIENLAPGSASSVYRKEREWVAAGQYRVSKVWPDTDSYGNPMVHVEIEEVASW